MENFLCGNCDHVFTEEEIERVSVPGEAWGKPFTQEVEICPFCKVDDFTSCDEYDEDRCKKCEYKFSCSTYAEVTDFVDCNEDLNKTPEDWDRCDDCPFMDDCLRYKTYLEVCDEEDATEQYIELMRQQNYENRGSDIHGVFGNE